MTYHERRHMLVLSCSECLESLISTEWYINSAKLLVGLTRSSCTISLIFFMSSMAPSSHTSSGSPVSSLRFDCISFTRAWCMAPNRSSFSHIAEFVQSSGARDSSAGPSYILSSRIETCVLHLSSKCSQPSARVFHISERMIFIHSIAMSSSLDKSCDSKERWKGSRRQRDSSWALAPIKVSHGLLFFEFSKIMITLPLSKLSSWGKYWSIPLGLRASS